MGWQLQHLLELDPCSSLDRSFHGVSVTHRRGDINIRKTSNTKLVEATRNAPCPIYRNNSHYHKYSTRQRGDLHLSYYIRKSWGQQRVTFVAAIKDWNLNKNWNLIASENPD